MTEGAIHVLQLYFIGEIFAAAAAIPSPRVLILSRGCGGSKYFRTSDTASVGSGHSSEKSYRMSDFRHTGWGHERRQWAFSELPI